MADTLTKAYLDKKLDKFATTVQRGFADVHKQMDERFGKLDARITLLRDDMQIRFTEQDRKIAELDQRLTKSLDTLTTNVDKFIKLHQKLDHELTALRAKYERLEDRVTRVEHRLELAAA